MGTESENIYRKMEWVQEKEIGTGNGMGTVNLYGYRKLDWVKDVAMDSVCGKDTGY